METPFVRATVAHLCRISVDRDTEWCRPHWEGKSGASGRAWARTAKRSANGPCFPMLERRISNHVRTSAPVRPYCLSPQPTKPGPLIALPGDVRDAEVLQPVLGWRSPPCPVCGRRTSRAAAHCALLVSRLFVDDRRRVEHPIVRTESFCMPSWLTQRKTAFLVGRRRGTNDHEEEGSALMLRSADTRPTGRANPPKRPCPSYASRIARSTSRSAFSS